MNDYWGNALVSFDMHSDGRVKSGVVESGEWAASFGLYGDLDIPEASVTVYGSDGFVVNVQVSADTATVPTVAREQELLTTGAFAYTDCESLWLAAGIRTAQYTLVSVAVVYTGAAVVYSAPAFITASGLIGPMRRSISRTMVAGFAAGVEAFIDSWESMHNAIQDLIELCLSD